MLDIKGRWPGLSVWLMVGLGAAVLSDEKGVGHGGAINVFINWVNVFGRPLVNEGGVTEALSLQLPLVVASPSILAHGS